MQNVLTKSPYFLVLYTTLLSYTLSVMCSKIDAGSSTLTPISTLLLLLSIPSLVQTLDIHLDPDLPVATIISLHLNSSSSVFTINSLPYFSISITSVLNFISILSFILLYKLPSIFTFLSVPRCLTLASKRCKSCFSASVFSVLSAVEYNFASLPP